MAKHLQGPMIHSLLLIFDRIIFNLLNTFGRKVIVVYERIPAENMKSAGLWVITMELFIIKMNSNFTFRWPIKTEHSAFKAVVTRVTLPSFRDSRYICDSRYEVQDSMVWCKKTKHV